jgi:pimeloyl-ACP methyl ester carboxylesterase
VLVHGAAADHRRWRPVLPALRENYTVYTVDRRGRGDSGDSETYAIEREFVDVASVVDSLGEPVNLLGHSYGALCSLEAALLTKSIRRMILYEPPIPVGLEIFQPGIIDRLQDLFDRGDQEGVVATFLREVVKVREQDLKLMQANVSAWKGRIATAQVLLRELRAIEGYTFSPERFEKLAVRTLLLLGGLSPKHMRSGTETLNQALPDSRIFVMPGQQHVAMDTATEQFTMTVLHFLK